MAKANNKIWNNKSANMAMVSGAFGLVVLLSILYIGLNIIDGVETGTAMDTPWDAANQTGDRFYDVNAGLTNTTASAYTMAGIMPIVLIAVTLLGAMLGLMFLIGRQS